MGLWKLILIIQNKFWIGPLMTTKEAIKWMVKKDDTFF